MKQDFIIDFESIGQDSTKCPAVDAAWATFYWDRFIDEPYSFEELTKQVKTVKFSVKDQIDRFGRSFTKDDLKWWDQQSPEAKSKLKPSKDDLTYEEFSATLFEYLRDQGKIEYWWSRGNSFDPVIIDQIMRSLKQNMLLNEYLRWWRVRDTRTWIDAKFNFSQKNGFIPVVDTDYWDKYFVAHDSTHDVAADILRLQAIHRAEHDLEQVNR